MQPLEKENIFIHNHRVGYAETDKMQFLHHSNYARIYENARWELFRSKGISYASIEELGIMMPVIKMDTTYIKPAFYDDNLKIKVEIGELTPVKVRFDYTIVNQNNETINKAQIQLAFMNSKSGRPTRTPEFILEKFKEPEMV